MRSVLAALAFVACAAVVQAQPFATKDLSTTTCPGAGCLILQVDGQGSIGIQVLGTFVGTLQFQQSIDPADASYVSLAMVPNTGGATVTSATAPGFWTGPIAGARYIRVKFSAYTSGTATVLNVNTLTRAQSNAPGTAGSFSSVAVGDGSQSLPSFTFTSETNKGFWSSGVAQISVGTGGTERARFTPDSILQLNDAGYIGLGSATDVRIIRDAANTPAIRNSTNAQVLNIYNTFTDASNYERLAVGFASNIAVIGPSALGTGTNRSMRFQVNGAVPTILFNIAGTDVWNISNAGNFVGITQSRGLGYGTGAGGAVTQITSRATGVTLNTVSGDITLFSAAGSATAASFTVSAGSFIVTFYTTGGTAVDAPVFHFSIVKGANS
jgi:hypothetical protein